MTTVLLLSLALQLTPINPLGTAHRNPHRIRDLLAQSSGPFGHVLLLDPQRQRGEHRGAIIRELSPVVAF